MSNLIRRQDLLDEITGWSGLTYKQTRRIKRAINNVPSAPSKCANCQEFDCYGCEYRGNGSDDYYCVD